MIQDSFSRFLAALAAGGVCTYAYYDSTDEGEDFKDIKIDMVKRLTIF